MYHKVNSGVCYSKEEEEGKRKRNQVDSIVEGVGITGRVTNNFKEAIIDKAYKVTDKEAVEMASYLLKNEGLFIGSSSALNCVGVVKLAKEIGPGKVIVTLLCDGGNRHLTKFWSPEFLEKNGLTPTAKDLEFIL